MREYKNPEEYITLTPKIPAEWASVPLDVRRRFPSMDSYQYESQDIWARLRKQLSELFSGLLDPLNDHVNDMSAFQSSAIEDIEALQEQSDMVTALVTYQNFF